MRYPHVPFLKRVWELRDNVTPSDAVYVGLAGARRHAGHRRCLTGPRAEDPLPELLE